MNELINQWNEKKTKQKKIEEPVLKLEEEEPLILEKVHNEKPKENKTVNNIQEKKISPAARKMASEANVDLNKIQGGERLFQKTTKNRPTRKCELS